MLLSFFAVYVLSATWLLAHKPKSDRSLALFYVLISLGSFLGGFLTSWIVPLISINTFEYMIGLVLIALARVFDRPAKKEGLATIIAVVAWAILLVALAEDVRALQHYRNNSFGGGCLVHRR